jgi:hypothetical protein
MIVMQYFLIEDNSVQNHYTEILCCDHSGMMHITSIDGVDDV